MVLPNGVGCTLSSRPSPGRFGPRPGCSKNRIRDASAENRFSGVNGVPVHNYAVELILREDIPDSASGSRRARGRSDPPVPGIGSMQFAGASSKSPRNKKTVHAVCSMNRIVVKGFDGLYSLESSLAATITAIGRQAGGAQ